MYTDGAAKGNPGPGGYGVVLKYKGHRKEISEGFRLTTNNRMELLAVIKGLEALKRGGLDVTIYSDSKYIVDAVTKGWLWNVV
jgi:ribonuclease HI